MTGPGDAVESVARAWTRAIADTSYVTYTSAEADDLLHEHARAAAAALRAGGLEPGRVGRELGFALVAAHYTDPQSLAATLVVYAQLGPALGGTAAALADLQGGIAAGYAAALRETTLTQQEAIRTAAFAARDESEARFRAVFSAAPIGIGLADLGGLVVEVNQALADMLGRSAEDFRGRHIRELAQPTDPPELWGALDDVLRGERDFYAADKEFSRSDGTSLWTHLRATVIRDELGRRRFLLGLFEDITERRTMHLNLRHQATHDPLTGLPNRTLFFEHLEEILGTADPDARIALCYLDLDGFKEVNDTLGHVVGDKLLIAVAERLAHCADRPGRLVARMGGDEFVMLLADGADAAAATEAADEILAALRRPIGFDGREMSVSASVGVVEHSIGGAHPTELVRAADITLYWAKNEGKGRWALFDADRSASEITRYTLSAALPGALERGEFTVDYQPIVDLGTGQVRAVEALVRWRHPDFGLLKPDRFIGLAEETGVIVPLGRWVLEQACAEAAKWEAGPHGPAPAVNVNLAVRQTHERHLVEEIRKALELSGLPPERLVLEVTESAVIGTEDGSLPVLQELAAHGIQIAIDDFGTGYSNLAYLRQLPAHIVKIDASFTAGLRAGSPDSHVDEQIVSALVTLAHGLGMSVTAEGVEDAEQAARLAALGCDSAQGWYFARAVPPDQLTGLLAREPAGDGLSPLDRRQRA
ncbi:MAG TPA: bifunctional diguanylate cyclase/phosphodiesterase [Actinocrinis sp.]|uniref:putative bifunctional diguanylate cyclase/phosphodiesterase n=1 Tax=Actinocrinis sp. TaxID=1920516 RepID=UPI002DDD887D|nr:bifunctional diguanylate cyclase/phosphodiesterase [Actinocrinis sp.]HEV3172075.1 bifunctional diguanylate cyclase/phosphodiesterase [Actinocrinis sp.]